MIAIAAVLILMLAVSSCATHAPVPGRVPAQAPLAANGSGSDVSHWWQSLADPLLVQLIASAQAASPALAQARSRIVEARAERVSRGAVLLPTLDFAASSARTSQQSVLPLGTISQAALQSTWEVDLFGANRANRDAAQARLEGAQALWHQARVALAAEVALDYYELRACQGLLAVAQQDATSRQNTARLTGLGAKAGFQAPATVALANASAAEGRSRLTAQGVQCALDMKALMAVSARPEAEIVEQLTHQSAQQVESDTAPIGHAVALDALPAATLSQRPDVFNAERAVAAASLEVGSSEAQRYPRLSLSGSVGFANFRSDGMSLSLDTWSIGPLAVSLPIFDGGRRRANLATARAHYEEAVITYRASVRQAVREVEQALLNVEASRLRSGDARIAREGYRISFLAFEKRYENGMASLLELEDARRTRLNSDSNVINLEHDRNAAWVALYRAAGGGWQPE